MATSVKGFSVDLDLVRAFHAFNKDKKEAYLLMKYSDDGKKLLLEEKGPAKKKNAKTYAEKNKHWEDVAAKLPDTEIKFIALQIDFKDAKGAAKNEILVIEWTPENCNIMQKMEITSHKPVIMKCFAGIRDYINVGSKTEMNVASIVKEKLKGSLD